MTLAHVPNGVAALPAAPGLTDNPLVTDALSVWPEVSTSVQVKSGVAAGAQLNGQSVAILPVPYPALGVAVPSGTWRVRSGDLMVYSTDTAVRRAASTG